MTTIKELFIEIIESLRERLKNPIIGAFAISWIVINWRIVLFLIYSNQSIEDKIRIIEECYVDINFNLIIPVGIAVFYLSILPYVSLGFDLLSGYALKRRREISHDDDIEDMKRQYDFDIEELRKQSEKEAEERIQSRARGANLEIDQSKKSDDKGDSRSSDSEQNPAPKESNDNKEETSKSKGSDSKVSSGRTSKKQSKSKPKVSTSNEEISAKTMNPSEYPTLKNVVMKDLPKSESEWVLVYAFYSSEYGKEAFTLADIRKKYRESNRYTSSRSKNAANNMRTLVRNDLVSYLNDKEMILKEDGKKLALNILSR